MDLLAPCRSCLQCLPFFQVSPPPSPRVAVVTAPSPSTPSHPPTEPAEATSTDPVVADTQSLHPDAPPACEQQGLPFYSQQSPIEPELIAETPVEDITPDVRGNKEECLTEEHVTPVEEGTTKGICEEDASAIDATSENKDECIIQGDAPPVEEEKIEGILEDGASLAEEENAETMNLEDDQSPAEEETESTVEKQNVLGEEGKVEDACEVTSIPEIVISAPVSSNETTSLPVEESEVNKVTVPSELPLNVPFINDITFSTGGLMPLPTPMTPAPFGAGYSEGHYDPYSQMYTEHHHGHHGGHGHGHGHGHDHHGHEHVPLPHPPSHNSGSSHGHHSHHPSHDHVASSDSKHNYQDGTHPLHDEGLDVAPLPPLEATQSSPDLGIVEELEAKDGGKDKASDMNGASGLLETYHSEPLVLLEEEHDDDYGVVHDGAHGHHNPAHHGRRRRRDHLKDHLMGIRQQFKDGGPLKDQFVGIRQQIMEGGHHLKEEGSKHLQTVIKNINNQAQQIEQSGSFFIVPRS